MQRRIRRGRHIRTKHQLVDRTMQVLGQQSSTLTQELGVFVADEPVGLGFRGILVVPEDFLNGAGIASEGACVALGQSFVR